MDDFKDILLLLSKKILSSAPESIRILRDTPMSSLKVLRGIAKGVRDPDPLSSTMVHINRKFPTTVDSTHPGFRFIPPDMVGPDDMHLYKRKICKKECIDVWLQNAETLSNDDLETAKLLYLHPDKQAKKYFSLDWATSRLSFGHVVLNKVYAPSQHPTLTVPKAIREPLLLQTLVPHLTIPYDEIDKTLANKMKGVASSTLSSKMNFLQQANILMDQMDPKVKLQPLPPGAQEWTSNIRYALSGSRWALVVNSENWPEDRSAKEESFKALIQLNKVCLIVLKKGIATVDQLRGMLKTVTLRGYNISSLMETIEQHDSISLKVLSILLKRRTTLSSEFMGVTFAPLSSGELRVIQRRNNAGSFFKTYKGRETVNFRRADIRGMFVHDTIFSILIHLPFLC